MGLAEGPLVGLSVGEFVGVYDGELEADGFSVPILVGAVLAEGTFEMVGYVDEWTLGMAELEGDPLGRELGSLDCWVEGNKLGLSDAFTVGPSVGVADGDALGSTLKSSLGSLDGGLEGLELGTYDGASEDLVGSTEIEGSFVSSTLG